MLIAVTSLGTVVNLEQEKTCWCKRLKLIFCNVHAVHFYFLLSIICTLVQRSPTAVCDLETSRMRRPWPALGCSTMGSGGIFVPTNAHTHTHIYIYLYYNIKFYYKCSMLRCFCTIFRELWFCVCYCVLPCNNLLLYAILIFCNFSKRNTRTLWSHLQRVLVLRLLKLQNIKIA